MRVTLHQRRTRTDARRIPGIWRNDRLGKTLGTQIPAVRQGILDSVFLWPMFLLIGFLVLVPTLVTVYRSFFDWNPGYESEFVGLGNYVEIFQSRTIRQIGINQLVFLMGVPLWVLLPLIVAVLLHERVPAAGVFRTIFFFPAIVSPVTIAILFRALLRPDGLINQLLALVGLDGLQRNWIDDPDLVKPVIILIVAWATLGFGVLLFGAALSTVPDELFEAAELDGAAFFQQLRYIILPAIFPIFLLVTSFSIATVFLLFGYVFVITQGGPGYASTTLDFDMYQNALNFGYYGVAAAEGTLLLLVMLSILASALIIGRRAWR